MSAAPLPSGSVIGIFGGGQLGRMLCQAARKLGYRSHIYDPGAYSPAGAISDETTAAAYEDLAAVRAFAKTCDVLSYEFENIPFSAVIEAAKHTPVFPDAAALKTAHDRWVEKTFLRQKADTPVMDFFAIESLQDMDKAAKILGFPCVLKTRRFGYDGKGQIRVDSAQDLQSCFASLGGTDLILEAFAPFTREFSVIAARAKDGTMACYPLTENVHKHHRLHTSIAPTSDPHNNTKKAQNITCNILQALDYVGVMGVEFFEMEDGQIMVNEIAPRVHNSGHWTQNAGCTDQFEQHIRAITGMSLGDTTPKHTVQMTNLIGAEIKQCDVLAKQKNTFVYDYAKCDIREGRKMGHVNRVIDT